MKTLVSEVGAGKPLSFAAHTAQQRLGWLARSYQDWHVEDRVRSAGHSRSGREPNRPVWM
jgi:hypothetical protein